MGSIMICFCCKGTGALFTRQLNKNEWFNCFICNTNGIREEPIGERTIKTNIPERDFGTFFQDRNDVPIIQSKDFEGKMMAHIMAHIKFFPSVTQAAKNGWNKPIECGRFKVGKKEVIIE